MHYLNFLYPALVASSTFIAGSDAFRSQKVKLSQIQSLTLRKGQQTSHRRVEAIPQLQCIGGSAKGLYEIDIMRCKNEGADYSSEDIQWKCQASLPEEFKLGSTDVICEGYDFPEDPYILKGSCGVKYRLVLTSKGEEKYGHRKGWFGDDDEGRGPQSFAGNLATALFWLVFIGVGIWIVWSAVSGWVAERGVPGGAGNRPGWGGGGGGGGWGGNDNDDPPPPYDYDPSQNPKRSYGTAPAANQGWRPGLWSGVLGGAAAGYAAGRAGGRNNQTSGWGNSRWGGDNGEGSSRSSRGSSSSPSYSSTRHESTGFGSTSRR